MPLDPDLKALLDRAPPQPRLETLTPAAARALFEARPRPPARAIGAVEERVVAGPGGDLRLRLYAPADVTSPAPLLVFLHGSGFVLCSLDTHDGLCRNLCAGSGYRVMSVDYRLAPEHPFPAAGDDALFAVRWAGEHADALGVRADAIVIGGDSAGGNLAAVSAIRLRDEGGPRLAGQLLIYPVTDHFGTDFPSHRENAEGFGLTLAGMRWFWSQYLSREADGAHPHASPLRAASLAGLPPALVHTAEYDVLRDEGEAYAARLAAEGVATHAVRWDGVNHGFVQLAGWVARADAAIADACAWLRRIAEDPRGEGREPSPFHSS